MSIFFNCMACVAILGLNIDFGRPILICSFYLRGKSDHFGSFLFQLVKCYLESGHLGRVSFHVLSKSHCRCVVHSSWYGTKQCWLICNSIPKENVKVNILLGGNQVYVMKHFNSIIVKFLWLLCLIYLLQFFYSSFCSRAIVFT